MTARIGHAALVLGPKLKEGGQGSILIVRHPADTDGGQLVFKRYRPELTAKVVAAALDALGDLPGRAGPDAIWLRERTAWPRTLVTEGPDVVGFLMRTIPDDFLVGLPTPSGLKQQPADFAFLLNEDKYLQDMGLQVSDRDRLLLLADVADALGRLHRLGACVGDLSPKNLLFALATHRTFFLDCDSMRLNGADVLPQTHTPDWELPGDEEPATEAADVFKFGLLAIRMFARDQSQRDTTRLGSVSGRLAALARASQDRDPLRRPSLADWIPELKSAAGSASSVPSSPTITVPIPPLAGLGAPAGTPTAGGPGSPAPPRNRAGLFATVGALAVVGVLGLGVATANGVFGSSDDNSVLPAITASSSPSGVPGSSVSVRSTVPTAPTSSDTPTPTPTPTPPPPPPPTSAVGVVQIDSSLVDDPRAVPVAELLDSYFSAITRKDFNAALALYDPSGDIDTTDSDQRAQFAKADATSSDDDGMLKSLSPGGTEPATTAEVTFRSRQAAGYGPSGNPDQTCTIWTLTYTLTYSDGKYLIKSAKGTPAGC